MQRRIALVLTAVALGACAPRSAEERSPDSTAAAPAPNTVPIAAREPAVDDLPRLREAASGPITEPLVQTHRCDNNCLGEGGLYRTEQAVTLLAAPDASAAVVAQLDSGTIVHAIGAAVYATRPPLVIRKALEGATRGDTMWVLRYEGEGRYLVQIGDSTASIELGFDAVKAASAPRCTEPPEVFHPDLAEHCWGELLKPFRAVVWQRFRLADGTMGWSSASAFTEERWW